MDKGQAGALRVLVVDDDQALGKLMVDIGDMCGFSVVTVHDPFRFEEHYSDEMDLLIIDLNMPGRSGLDILRSLAMMGSRVPLLLMSGTDRETLHATVEGGDWGNGLEIVGELEKPFRVNEFVGLVRDVLSLP